MLLPPDDVYFVYVHGFRSSPESFKAKLLVEWFAEQGMADRLSVPKLHHSPKQAIQQLQQLIAECDLPHIMLIGSSLGGFYSTWLVEHDERCAAVLINPGVTVDSDLDQYVGTNEIFYTGETFELLPEHIQEMRDLYLDEVKHSQKYLLMVQTLDETLDFKVAVNKYLRSRCIIQPGGSHGFDRFEAMIPSIMNFAEQAFSRK